MYSLRASFTYPHQRAMSLPFRYFKEATLAADMALFAAGSQAAVEYPWRIEVGAPFIYETRGIRIEIHRHAT